MFGHLTSQLRDEVETVQKVLTTSDGLRNLLIVQYAALSSPSAEVPEGADDITKAAHALGQLLPRAPDKLDWQIYDHCAALTRLYAIYERFVGELVTEYVRQLPKLYQKYVDLPSSITTQHRAGIGQILLKMGEKGLYKKLEESVVVRELAAAIGGSSAYTLLADAFFVERQNLRFEILCRLFSTLGFKNPGKYINKHSAVTKFMKEERADSSSAQKELEDFIDYRNEAAHRKVENVLAIDAIGAIGRFLIALGYALADMIEQGALQRRMELEHYSLVMAILEVHYDGLVVVGIPALDISLKVGDEVVVFAKNACHRVRVESIQANGQSVQNMTGDGAVEFGIRLNKPASEGAELRRLQIPTEAPKEIQLKLEDAMPPISDAADTDISNAVESENIDSGSEDDQPNAGRSE